MSPFVPFDLPLATAGRNSRAPRHHSQTIASFQDRATNFNGVDELTPVFSSILLLASLAPKWCSHKALSMSCGGRRSLGQQDTSKRARQLIVAVQSLRGGTQPSDFEDNDVDPSVATDFPSPTLNPLWPDGVNEEDVNDLISICLKDPQLNIRGIPDALEQQLYKSIIRLTLDGIYHGLSTCHGRSMLGHWISIARTSGAQPESRSVFRAALKQAMEELEFERDVEEDVLEMVADRMLANPDVNLRFLPDGLERALYVNCLKVLFRVLNLLSATISVTVCGHDMKLHLETSTRYALQEAALRQSSNNLNTLTSSLDFEQVKNFVRTSRIMENSEDLWFWQRWWSRCNPTRYELMVQLHASLYSLLLSILDDLMDHTSIEILSDSIRFDVVSGEGAVFPGTGTTRRMNLNAEPQSADPGSNKMTPACRPFRSFLNIVLTLAVGIGAGLSLQKVIPLPPDFPILEQESLPPTIKGLMTTFGLGDPAASIIEDEIPTKPNDKPWWR
jgi:hypothetical protein